MAILIVRFDPPACSFVNAKNQQFAQKLAKKGFGSLARASITKRRMKLKFTHKELMLLIGVAVALLAMLTLWVLPGQELTGVTPLIKLPTIDLPSIGELIHQSVLRLF